MVDYWVGEAMILVGFPEKARTRLQRVYEAAVDPAQRSDAARLIGRTFELAHLAEEAQRWLDRAEHYAGEDTYRLLRIRISRANILGDMGKLDEAMELYRAVRKETRRSDLMELDSAAVTNLAACLMMKGRLEKAEVGFKEALKMQRMLRNRSVETVNLVNLGMVYVWMRRWEQALKALEKARKVALELGETGTIAEVDIFLGAAIAHTSSPREGRVRIEKGRDGVVLAGLREAQVAAELQLLRVALKMGDSDTAAMHLARCSDFEEDLMKFPLFSMELDALRKQMDTAAV